MQIEVRLHNPTSWYGRLVAFFTNSHYSHTSLLVGGWVYEAEFGAGVTRKLPNETAPADESFPIVLPAAQFYELQRFLVAQVGKKYDLKAVLRFLAIVRLVGGDDPSTIQEARRQRGRWFCSELTFAALQHVGVNLLARIQPWQVSPGMLALSPLL